MIRLIIDVINTDLAYPMKLLSHTMLKFVYRIRYRNPPFFTQCGIRTQDFPQAFDIAPHNQNIIFPCKFAYKKVCG